MTAFFPILLDSSKKLVDLVVDKTNGLGRLTDATAAEVNDELNGSYTATIKYPITGLHYSDIKNGGMVKMKANELSDPQIFIIKSISKPINGIVTISLNHVSYYLSKTSVAPLKTTGANASLQGIHDNMIGCEDFTFVTDLTNATSSFENKIPQSARALFGGQEGSFLDVFGGEFEWDNLTVFIHKKRGSDNGVTIRYGKNLTDLTQDESVENIYTDLVPYVVDPTNNEVIYGDTQHIIDGRKRILNVDLSDVFGMQNGTIPDVISINDAAKKYIQSNKLDSPKVSIKISFIPLWQTEEYKDIAPLERVSLGDTVHVFFSALGVNATARVISYTWDCLKGRYSKMELGDAKSKLSETIVDLGKNTEKEIDLQKDFFQQALKHATEMLTGAYGGHVVLSKNADGKPNEIFIMDTDDVATAKKVLRMNMNGIGGSTSGVNGPFNAAMLIDGSIVADRITTGTLQGIRIEGNEIVGGSISGTTITGGSISGGTITGGTISGTQISGSVLQFGSSETVTLQSNGNDGAIMAGTGSITMRSVQDMLLQNTNNSGSESNHIKMSNANGNSTFEIYNRSPAYIDANNTLTGEATNSGASMSIFSQYGDGNAMIKANVTTTQADIIIVANGHSSGGALNATYSSIHLYNDSSNTGNNKIEMSSRKFFLYSVEGISLCAGNTFTTVGAYHLDVQEDGNVVLYNPHGTAIWQTGTAGM